MNSLKLLALSRIPAKRTGTQIVRQLSSTSVKQRYGSGYRNPYEDSLLSVGSNMMRSMEREMENAMRSFNRFMPTQFFLPSSNAKTNTASLAKSKSDQNELVTTDESGNRNFSLPLDLSDFSPEEIRIRTDADHNMTITAKKEIAVIHSKNNNYTQQIRFYLFLFFFLI
jgi:HSP20 family molecular chaperone IbpA